MSGLALKHRPKTFDEVYGNERAIESLESVLNRPQSEVPKAILFHGPRGCGKTTLARCTCEFLGANEFDIEYYDITKTGLKEDAIKIKNSMRYKPQKGKYRVFILDEVHEASSKFQHGLLLPLEDGPHGAPDFVLFMLCTTDPQKMLKTLLDRCVTHIRVNPLEEEDAIELLEDICEEEEIDLSEKQLTQIVRAADGIPRRCLSFLDQISGVDKRSINEVIKGLGSDEESEVVAKEICQALIKQAPWQKVVKLIDGYKDSPERLRRAIMGYMAGVLRNSKREPTAQAIIVMESFKDMYTIVNNGKAGLYYCASLIYME
jgi:DNA polymerase-3 subunit gamma/tau